MKTIIFGDCCSYGIYLDYNADTEIHFIEIEFIDKSVESIYLSISNDYRNYGMIARELLKAIDTSIANRTKKMLEVESEKLFNAMHKSLSQTKAIASHIDQNILCIADNLKLELESNL